MRFCQNDSRKDRKRMRLAYELPADGANPLVGHPMKGYPNLANITGADRASRTCNMPKLPTIGQSGPHEANPGLPSSGASTQSAEKGTPDVCPTANPLPEELLSSDGIKPLASGNYRRIKLLGVGLQAI